MIKKLDKIVEILISILFVSIFLEAKGVFNIGVLLLLIMAIFKAVKYKIFMKEKIFYWYLGGIMIGLIPNIINGTAGAYLSNVRGLLYILIFVLLNLRAEQYDRAKEAVFYSGLVSALYSGISYITPKFLGVNTLYNDYRNSGMRMQSFTNVIRWGSLLQVLNVFGFIKLIKNKSLIKNIFMFLVILLFMGNILINGTRAGMLGIMGGYLFLLVSLAYVFKSKVIKYLFPIILVSSIFVSYLWQKHPDLKERAGSITSTIHPSNKVRLDFYKIGYDIIKEKPLIGYGTKRAGKVFETYIRNQTEEYRDKYYNNSIKASGGTPFENNYINLTVENGILFTLYINIVFWIIFIKILGSVKELADSDKIKVLILLATIFGNKIFIFFFAGTDFYVDFIVMFLLFYAYELTRKK